MSPNFLESWEHILEEIEKSKIPIHFVKKLVVKLKGKRQHTINVVNLLKQGLEPDEIEEVVNRKLNELDDEIVGIEFILNVKMVAETVQPETDKLLSRL